MPEGTPEHAVAGGLDVTSFATVQAWRTVLAVTRNVVSTHRLLDVLPVFGSDSRVEVLFTIAEENGEPSAFAEAAKDLLHGLDARTIPWSKAVGREFDLALSASYRGDLTRLRAPLLVLPHGAGHNRYLPGSKSVPGLSRDTLLHNGRPIARSIVLSGPEQVARLSASCPEVLDRVTVAGDPCFDRLLASRELLHGYRLQVLQPGQKLVLLSSTWSGRSLLATWTDLAAQLLAALPVDEFRVAITIHPNVWAYHGGWQLGGWLAEARNAGLLVLPPDGSWRAALTAADLVIGDHGSVSLYAAALGKPLLLAAHGASELEPASPAARLGKEVSRLDPKIDLRRQVIAALDSEGYADRVAGMLSAQGDSLSRLRRLCYELMDLAPSQVELFAAPVPCIHTESQPVKAHRVVTEVNGRTVKMERFPAALASDQAGQIIVAWEDEPNLTLRHHAAVLVGHQPGLLERYPGCRMVAVPTENGCLIRTREAETIRVVGGADVAILAAAAYAHDITGAGRIQVGERCVDYIASR